METTQKSPAVERKLKTIVIMDVPGGPLLCCRIEDLTLTPERGSSYVLEGRLYDVERAIEVIGIYKLGSRKSTDEQLLSLVKMLSGDEQAMIRLANMRNIGTEEEGETTGGIILATSLSFTANADRLVYLRLRGVRFGNETDGMVALARQAIEAGQSGGAKKADSAANAE
jgi:hypothetical protein